MENQVEGNGVQRDLGVLEAKQGGMDARLSNLERDVGQILLYVTTIKGLIHVAMALGGTATGVVAVVEIVRWFK